MAINGWLFGCVEWIHWAQQQEYREEQVRHRRIFPARPWIRSTTPHPRPALAQTIDIPVSWQRDRTFIFSSVVRHVILPLLRWTTRSCFASNVNLLLCSLRYHSTTTTDTKAGTPHNASGCHPRRHAGRLRPVRRLRRPTFAQRYRFVEPPWAGSSALDGILGSDIRTSPPRPAISQVDGALQVS